MGAIVGALVNVAAKNPALVEALIEGLGQLLVAEIQKAVAAAQAAK